MISKKVFTGDGVNKRFLSDFIIQSEQFARPYVYIYDNTLNPNGSEDVLQDVGLPWTFPTNLYRRGTDAPDSGEDLLTIDKWDLVDNSILTYEIALANTHIWIEVATTPEEFGNTLTAPSVERAETAAADALASEIAAASSEANASTSETNAAASEAAVAADLLLTNADVVSTNADVLLTDANAVITNADVVSTNADVVSTNADAAATALDKIATNADVVSTNADAALAVSSAASAAISESNAQTAASGLTKTSSRNSVISAPTGVHAKTTVPTPSHFDRTYVGNGTSQDIIIGGGDGAENVTNGTFTTDVSGWASYHWTGAAYVADATRLTWNAGQASLNNGTGVSDYAGMEQALSGLVIGTPYELIFTTTGNPVHISIGETTAIGTTAPSTEMLGASSYPAGKVVLAFKATATTAYLNIQLATAVDSAGNGVDAVSVKEITAPLASVSRPWVASASYTIGDYKIHAYIIYEALTTHTGVATTPDADVTNWVAIADDVVVDADNADIWIKERSPIARSHSRSDTLRGAGGRLDTSATTAEIIDIQTLASFNVDGFSVGTNGAVNANTELYVAWCEYFDKMVSGVTSNGKRYVEAFNAQSGKGIRIRVGSGAVDTVPHSLGTKIDFNVCKSRDVINGWTVYNSASGATEYQVLSSNAASATATTVWDDTEPTNILFTLGTSSGVNTLNVNYIDYYSSNRNNHSYVGGYVGTGAAGNPVDVGMDLLALDTAGKNIKVMVKTLTAVNSWLIFDNTRSTDGVKLDRTLLADTSGIELTTDYGSLTNSGISLNDFNPTNALDVQYLIEVTVEDFDNADGGIQLNPTTTSFANGTGATGDLDLVSVQPSALAFSLIAGTTNYLYEDYVSDVLVSVGSTIYPLIEAYPYVTPDANSDTYDVAEGIMYGKGAELVPLDTDWTAGADWTVLNGVWTHTGTVWNTTQASGLTAGNSYVYTFDVTFLPANGNIAFYQNNVLLASISTLGSFTLDFIATGTTVQFGSAKDGAEVSNISVKQLGVPTSRVYTGSIVVDAGGEIIPETLIERAVKNQNFTDVTVHGDLEVLGGFDLGQRWVDVTADRYPDVIYTNNTGKPMEVIMYQNTSVSTVYIDGLNVGAVVGVVTNVASLSSFTVPAGSTYYVAGEPTKWAELR